MLDALPKIHSRLGERARLSSGFEGSNLRTARATCLLVNFACFSPCPVTPTSRRHLSLGTPISVAGIRTTKVSCSPVHLIARACACSRLASAIGLVSSSELTSRPQRLQTPPDPSKAIVYPQSPARNACPRALAGDSSSSPSNNSPRFSESSYRGCRCPQRDSRDGQLRRHGPILGSVVRHLQ